ncbi:dipeptidase PepE [Flavobacterium sp. 20NA77.7]|uniref:Dipeptidase PepE n=1 Tax=Flavobacterium nakdongensis TaxID=3073563 RepID=A0ABY9RBK8_9FLAO|nr:dipeptidase PepE [Flavobacterium sp. 20NA77.7]WMW78208.1 dipeptidase PepE [Flavobacterium sp. 20NA77.7]
MKKIIIASTSTLYNGAYLDYLLPELRIHFKEVKELIFIPFARPGGISYDEYTAKVSSFFANLNIQVKGIHEFENPKQAIANAQALFTGGGNTFVLVDMLYKYDLFESIAESVSKGVPYLGTSAGSNICGLTMGTTNDMPIVCPPSFKTLGLVSFNINPHYLDPVEGSTHMGETRETRINEFHCYNPQAVLGLREGSWLEVIGDTITLKGNLTARLFQQGKEPIELESGTDLSNLK